MLVKKTATAAHFAVSEWQRSPKLIRSSRSRYAISWKHYCIRLPLKYLLTMIVSSERYRLSHFIEGPVSQLRFTIASNLLLLIITQVCATCLRAFVCVGASPSAPSRQVLQYDYVWHVLRDQYVEKKLIFKM